MTPTLVVIDDLLPNPDEVREAVLNQEFKDVIGPDGAPYKNIGTNVVPDIYSKIADIYGRDKIDVKLSFVRMDPEGSETHSFCHADKICANYAALLYLNPPEQCSGGTAFYRHKPTGLDALPSDAAVQMLGMELGRFHNTMTNETKNPDSWDMVGFVGMKFNRLITYPSKMWHSRFPHASFGKTKQNSRIVQVVFFDLM